MVVGVTGTNPAGHGIDAGGQHICSPTGVCIKCLAVSALARELTEDQIQTLSNIIEVRKLAKNEILISQGEHDDHLYAIVKGYIEVSLEGSRNHEVLARVGSGNLIGELAFLDGLKRTATVRAASDDCCVYALRRNKLESLLNTDPSLVYNVMRAIVRSAHRTVGKMDVAYLDLMQYISGTR